MAFGSDSFLHGAFLQGLPKLMRCGSNVGTLLKTQWPE